MSDDTDRSKLFPNRDRLGQWAPGVSGNPHGRPRKGKSLTELLKENLDTEALAQEIARRLLDGSNPGLQFSYIKLAWDKLDRGEGEGLGDGMIIILPSNGRELTLDEDSEHAD